MKFERKMIIKLGAIFLTLMIGSFIVAWVSNGFYSINGWLSFLIMFILVALLCAGAILSLYQEDVPHWLIWLVFGAGVLRLLVGMFFFVSLPEWGYGSPVEHAGYVMSDAYERDTTAWNLSQTDKPILTAFKDYRKADQYGGMLFLSATVYRYLGGDHHQPLLMVVLVSFFSALLPLYVWAFVNRLWGNQAAKIAAWITALYPDGVLVGSSQMREAFTMALASIAVYGFIIYWEEKSKKGLILVLGTLLISLPLSPFFAGLLFATLVILAFFINDGRFIREWRVWITFLIFFVILLGVFWLLGDRIIPGSNDSPFTLIQDWLKSTAKWQLYISESSSGWVQKVLRNTPEWTHVFLLVTYGIARPFLPAAVVASGKPIWRAIAIWRSLGWALLLPFLVYAPIRAFSNLKKRWVAFGLSIATWFSILIASFRSGGDQWDNPRYRLSLLGLQAALVAWVVVTNRENPDPWLRRVLIAIFAVLIWFLPWYLRRYTMISWSIDDVFKTLGLGLSTAALLWVWDWVKEKR